MGTGRTKLAPLWEVRQHRPLERALLVAKRGEKEFGDDDNRTFRKLFCYFAYHGTPTYYPFPTTALRSEFSLLLFWETRMLRTGYRGEKIAKMGAISCRLSEEFWKLFGPFESLPSYTN